MLLDEDSKPLDFKLAAIVVVTIGVVFTTLIVSVSMNKLQHAKAVCLQNTYHLVKDDDIKVRAAAFYVCSGEKLNE